MEPAGKVLRSARRALQRRNPTARELPATSLGQRIRQRRHALLDAVEQAGGADLRLFGSVARGEDDADSDVDLLVNLPADASLFTLLALEGTLERILGVHVDLATESSLKPRVLADALADAIAV